VARPVPLPDQCWDPEGTQRPSSRRGARGPRGFPPSPRHDGGPAVHRWRSGTRSWTVVTAYRSDTLEPMTASGAASAIAVRTVHTRHVMVGRQTLRTGGEHYTPALERWTTRKLARRW